MKTYRIIAKVFCKCRFPVRIRTVNQIASKLCWQCNRTIMIKQKGNGDVFAYVSGVSTTHYEVEFSEQINIKKEPKDTTPTDNRRNKT